MTAEHTNINSRIGTGRISIASIFGIAYLFVALCILFDLGGLSLPALESSAGLLLGLGALGLVTVFRRFSRKA